MITFKKTQENGDATSNYDVSFPEGMTIVEFITEVRKAHPEDWFGSFYLNGFNSIGEYRNDKVYIDARYANIKPSHIWANGGWGAMSYFFYDKEE